MPVYRAERKKGSYCTMLSVSKLYMMYRKLIVDLYDTVPALPHTVDIQRVDSSALHISVEAVKAFGFPVYKITLPFMLPNKRKTNASLFKNAITETVYDEVRVFRQENDVSPIKKATVIFLSYYSRSPIVVADNDNKDCCNILNALCGVLLRDDNLSTCNNIYYSRRVESGAWTEIFIVDSEHDIEVLS